MITVRNDDNTRFSLGAKEMCELPNGYKMSRLDLKDAIQRYADGGRTKVVMVVYGYTSSPDETHTASFRNDGDYIQIGCCDFYGEEADKLRKWAERAKNGTITGTGKRTGKGKDRNRKAAARTAGSANRAGTSKARPRKTAVAARRSRAR